MASKVSTETVTPQKSIGDNLNYSFNYVYDDSYAHRLISAGDRYYKYDANGNIYLGDTRIVTKLNSGDEPTYNEEYYKQYYYHSDHLGSASLITDYKGDEYQRIEYTPLRRDLD